MNSVENQLKIEKFRRKVLEKPKILTAQIWLESGWKQTLHLDSNLTAISSTELISNICCSAHIDGSYKIALVLFVVADSFVFGLLVSF